MAEKVTSMRLNEEDLEIFKVFAKDNGLNQQQAFNSLIALAELEKSKDKLGDRAKEIDAFRDTMNKLLNFYINSLEINTTAEQSIREEFSKELNTKDDTIKNLIEQLQDSKISAKELNDQYAQLKQESSSLQSELTKTVKEAYDKQQSIDKLNSNNDLLQEQLKEYKQYKENYKELEHKLQQVQLECSNKTNEVSNLNNNIKQLEDKVKNSTSMVEFYKAELDSKDKFLKECQAYNKELDIKSKERIDEIKKENEKNLQEQISTVTIKLQSKHDIEMGQKDIEISQKDIEIQKLQNEIKALKSKKQAK